MMEPTNRTNAPKCLRYGLSKFAVSITLLALTGVGLSASPVVAHDARAFSFPDVAYYTSADAARAAEAFIDSDLPEGISLARAEERLRAAGMGCAEGSSHDSAICHYYTVVGGDGGSLGEMWWTMQLQTDLGGRLASAHFDQSRIGMSP